MTFFTAPFMDVVALLMLQLMIILLLAKVVFFVLKRVGQPLVVSEVISGILLGPSVIGKIPGFTDTVFPTESLPLLNCLAQIGLILFMYIVGLTLDINMIIKNWKKALSSSAGGLVFVACAAVPIAFIVRDDIYTSASMVVIILVIVIVFDISALALLARLLGERHLLMTELGVLTLCTTAYDTFLCWVLLAVVNAINATSNGSVVNALAPIWIVLLSVVHLLLLWFIVRRFILTRLSNRVEKKGQLEMFIFFISIVMTVGISWFTEMVGISGMLGAFELGLVTPRNGPMIRFLKEKLEDVVVVIMIPVFFTYSGLRTNFWLLDRGEDWGIMGLCVVAAATFKIAGSTIPSKIGGLGWWHCAAYGILMSCKGLVALTIINIVMDLGLVTQRLFTIMVGYCLVATVLTTPILRLILWMQSKFEKKPKSKKKTFNMFLLPRTPAMAPPIVTLAELLTKHKVKSPLPRKITAARIVDPNEHYSEMGIYTRKQLKQDIILGPANQRANFFKIRLDFQLIITTNPVHDLLETVNAAPEDMILIGDDQTSQGIGLINGLLRNAVGSVGVFVGPDIGNVVGRILLPYGAQTEDNMLALAVVRTIMRANKERSLVVLLLEDAPPMDELEFLSTPDYFGHSVHVSVVERREEASHWEAITMEVNEQADISLLVMGQLDMDHEHEHAHLKLGQVMERLATLPCACLYLAKMGSSVRKKLDEEDLESGTEMDSVAALGSTASASEADGSTTLTLTTGPGADSKGDVADGDEMATDTLTTTSIEDDSLSIVENNNKNKDKKERKDKDKEAEDQDRYHISSTTSSDSEEGFASQSTDTLPVYRHTEANADTPPTEEEENAY